MTAIAKRIAYNYTLNRNTGSFGSPAWTPIIRAVDIKRNLDASADNDGSDRGSQFARSLTSRYKLGYDFGLLPDSGAGHTALRNAFTGGTVLDLAAIDGQPGQSSTCKGYRGEFNVTKFNLDMPLVGEQKIDCSIQPAANHTVAQQVAVYTDATVAPGTAETDAAAKKLGKNASVNDSTHAPITQIRDIKLNLEWKTADGGDRAVDIEQVLLVQMMVSAELTFIMDRSNAQLTAIETAFQAHSLLEYWILDGAYVTSGSWGVHSDWEVLGLPTDAPLVDGQKYTVTLKPAANAVNLPAFVTI